MAQIIVTLSVSTRWWVKPLTAVAPYIMLAIYHVSDAWAERFADRCIKLIGERGVIVTRA